MGCSSSGAGNGSSAQASQSTAPIVIGLTTPLAASSGGYGVPIEAGLKLYINKVNASGGVHGRKIVVNVQDNACTSSGGVTSVEKLLSSSPEPVAILGGFCSDSTAAAVPIIQRAQVPLLIDGAAATDITAKAGVGGDPWLFRWVDDNEVVADATIQNLKAHGLTKIAIVADSMSYGRDGASSLQAAAKADGVQVLSTDLVDLTSPDFSSILARLQSEKPQAVALWLTTAQTFYDQYGQSGLRSTPLAGQVDMTQKAIATDGLTGWDTYQYSNGINTPQNKQFLAAWSADGQQVANTFEGYDGYEAGKVIAAALDAAKSYTPSGVQSALENLNLGPTLAGGRIQFDDHGQAHDNIANIAFTGAHETTTLLTPAQIK